MSADIVSVKDGIITLRVSGRLTQPDLASVQDSTTETLRQQTKARILIYAEDFDGWEQGGKWEDLSFMEKNDQYMERMAIVGEKKWEDLTLLFAGKGLRHCLVEYFPPEDAAKAYAWLMEDK